MIQQERRTQKPAIGGRLGFLRKPGDDRGVLSPDPVIEEKKKPQSGGGSIPGQPVVSDTQPPLNP
ncbi:MAG: hypothetical protein WC841_04485 [Candidatus Shapirobacteria bacterium]|jgi:hypothetical protein